MGKWISELTYDELKPLLNENSIVVLPIGGGAKEHGEHLPMGTDFYVTNYIAKQLTERSEVLTLPTLPYAYFPAFVKWEGSVSIPHEHFTAYVEDILATYIRCGVKKFLIIDGGFSTHPPLCMMARDMDNKYDVKVAVSDITQLAIETEEELCTQKRGGHGDESETSTMLYIRPDLVHMEKAVEEYSDTLPGRVNGRTKVYLSSRMNTAHGVNGNSTLATKEKGEQILDSMVDALCNFVEEYREWIPKEERRDK